MDAAAKKASFDSADFINLLKTIRDLTDQGWIRTGSSKASDDLFKTIQAVNVPTVLFMPQMQYGGKSKVYRTPGAGTGSGVSFAPNLMLAMNEKSKVKDEAWQFLQFLLSDEMQSAPGFNGFPVRQSSLRKTVGGIMEKLQNGKVQIRVQSQDGQTTQQPTVGDKDKETVLQIAGMADTYIYEDTQVMRIAREEADAFFKGEKSAEDTARSIQNRVTTYLNE